MIHIYRMVFELDNQNSGQFESINIVFHTQKMEREKKHPAIPFLLQRAEITFIMWFLFRKMHSIDPVKIDERNQAQRPLPTSILYA